METDTWEDGPELPISLSKNCAQSLIISLLLIYLGVLFVLYIGIKINIFPILNQIDSPLTFLLTIIVGVITAYIVSRYTFYKDKQLEYHLALYPLLKEIEENNNRMDTFLNDFNVIKGRWISERGTDALWIPNKRPSFGFSTKVWQYFPCSAFNNFMNRGYHLNIGDQNRLALIMELFSISINFSNFSQNCEQIINRIRINPTSFRERENIDELWNLTAGATSDLIIEIPSPGGNNIEKICREIETEYERKRTEYHAKYSEFDIKNLNGLILVYWWQKWV